MVPCWPILREVESAETARMPLSSWIFAAVAAAVDGEAEPAQEIASQKIYSEKLIKILRSGGVWPGPSAMKS